MKKWKSLLLVAIIATGCGLRDNTDTAADEELTASVEDAVTTMSAIMDDQEGESYSVNSQKSYHEMIEEILLPKAYAAGCIRPAIKVCDNGVKTSTFSDCSGYRGLVTASGEITLNFSENDCSMDTAGDNVNRTYSYTFDLPRGGQLEVSSADGEDYSGDVIGGGALLTKTVGGFELDILGKHKVYTRNDRVRLNRSVKTLQPLQIIGGLRRSVRRVTDGQVQVSHNLAEFKAVYTADSLEWSSSCCHPVSGTLSVDYTGSREGSGTVTFGSCGTATLDKDGETHEIQFSYCE